jgi:UDP-N-acetylmuramoyl-tripeptide--D-alanyl-D-alanine ligase
MKKKKKSWYNINMKPLIQYILKVQGKRIFRKYKPDVIGITGSVGKTSAKEAVFIVLKNKFSVRRSIKNYNNEIGLPLTLIGEEAKGKDFFGWFKVFSRALALTSQTDKDYPKVMILEMGADKPGDIAYLLKIVKCKIGMITRIGESHLEAFKTVDRIKKEKALIVRELEKTNWAVLNFDDERIKDIAKDVKANYISYGIHEKADLQASEINLMKIDARKNDKDAEGREKPELGAKSYGLSFKMLYKGSAVPVILEGVAGQSAIYACLAGAAAGIIYGMNLIEITDALKNYKNPKGRMNFIPGVKRTLILDDTYNSSPQSSLEALEVLSKLMPGKNARRYAVFGDMLELGEYTEAGHREVGEKIAELEIDELIVVGERSRDIARGAKQAGMSDDFIFHFSGNETAAVFLKERIKEGDIILVKGSQAVRMEKVVKELMADPLRAGELLVRQGEDWA